MSKIVTIGKRYIKDGRWHDDRGPIGGRPSDWDPPMTDEDVEMAALADPDAQPMTEDELERMVRIPFAKHVRWHVGLSQAEFSRRYRIPLGTLRDWEQARAEPDAAAATYLAVIKAEPEVVAKALERKADTAANQPVA